MHKMFRHKVSLSQLKAVPTRKWNLVSHAHTPTHKNTFLCTKMGYFGLYLNITCRTKSSKFASHCKKKLNKCPVLTKVNFT